MFSRRKETPGERMYFTPHSAEEVEALRNRFRGAEEVSEKLERRLAARGAAWDDSVNISLAQLNDGMAVEEPSAGTSQPKIKPTVMKFRCVRRAAVTAQLEITKGLRELAIGWIEVGDVVQAQAIGTTMRTGRQRILDSREWEQGPPPGLPGPGWISIMSVDRQQLLEPLGVQEMAKPLGFQPLRASIRTDQSGWEGSAHRLGVGFEYDPTFLPPDADKLGRDGLKRRSAQAETRMRATPAVATESQKLKLQDEASQRTYSGMVRALFTAGSSVNRDVHKRSQEEAAHLSKYPWPPKEDPPPPLAFGHQPEKNVGHYYAKRELDKSNPIRANPIDPDWERRPLVATGPSSFIDSDYLSHLAKRYGDEEPLLANLAAERTAELNKSYSGISTGPSERRTSNAIDLDALDPGKYNRRRPRTSDGALRLSWAQRCLSHDDAPYRGQMIDYVSTDFDGAEWLTLGDRPRTADGQEGKQLQKAPERVSFADAGSVPPPTAMRATDAKRYSAHYAKKIADHGRKKKNTGMLAFEAKAEETKRLSTNGGKLLQDTGVLAKQANSMHNGGVYRRGTDSVARRLIEEEVQKIEEERVQAARKVREEAEAARVAAEAEEARLAAEAKAAEEAKEAAKVLRGQLELVAEIGGIDKVRSQTLHSEDAEIREIGQELLDALPDNVEELLYKLVKEKAIIRMADLEGEDAVPMAEWSEEDALDWATGVGLLLHAAVENTDWTIMPTGQCTMSEVLHSVFKGNRLDGRDAEKMSVALMGANLRKAGLVDCPGCSVVEAAQLVIQHRDQVLTPPESEEQLEARQHAAATKIQARQRGRSGRRRVVAMLEPEPEPEPEPVRYIKPSTIQRLVGFGNAEALARANGVENLGQRIYENDMAQAANAKAIETTRQNDKRNNALTQAQKKEIFRSMGAFEEYAASTVKQLKDLLVEEHRLERLSEELHSLTADMYTTLKMVAVRKNFDMQGTAIHTLRAGDQVRGLKMRVDPVLRQPRLLVEVRHCIKGWVNLMTEGHMTVLVERTSAVAAAARAEKARARALAVADGGKSAVVKADPVLEAYKTKLRGVTYDSGTRTDGSSIKLPWSERFDKYDTDRSGLLNPTEFYRCIRRYCNDELLSDHDIEQLLAVIDADGSGEISIEEFELFLHDSPGYREEVKAATSIQARFRGRRVRQNDGYKASVKHLEHRADAQAEQLKRRMRGMAYSRGGIDWHTVFCRYDTDESGQLDWNEFRIACRGDGNFSVAMISDRELLILFKRLDSDGSGEISYAEFESFLHDGPTATAEVDAVIHIQARQRGKMARRHMALQGIKMFKCDVERDNWKLEVLTNDTLFDKDGVACGMWGVLSAALSKHGRGAVIFLNSIDRAEWLAMRLVDKKDMAVTVITGNQDPDQRKRIIDEWSEGRGEHGAPDRDRYGRRRLIIIAEMPSPQSLMELRLSDLRLQLAVHFDAPKSWMLYMPRHIAPFPRYKTLLDERGVSVVFYSGGKPDSERLGRFETQSGYPLAELPDDAARQMFALVDKMRIEAAKKRKALGLAAAARSKEAGDSWLPDVLETYEGLLEKGAAAMRAAKYDLACEIYVEAAASLNWKEEEEDGGSAGEAAVADPDELARTRSDITVAAVVSPAAMAARLGAKRNAENAA
jgi:Ca2+-binding EF-hand superfamily protein